MWSYSDLFVNNLILCFSQHFPVFIFLELLIFYISVSKRTNQIIVVSWLIVFKLNKRGCFSSSSNSDSPVFLWEIVLHGPLERTKAKPHMSYIWALKLTIMRLNRWLVIYLVQISAPSSPSHAEERFILILCLVFFANVSQFKENKANEGIFNWIGTLIQFGYGNSLIKALKYFFYFKLFLQSCFFLLHCLLHSDPKKSWRGQQGWGERKEREEEGRWMKSNIKPKTLLLLLFIRPTGLDSVATALLQRGNNRLQTIIPCQHLDLLLVSVSHPVSVTNLNTSIKLYN